MSTEPQKSEASELKDLFLIVGDVGRIKSGRITVTNTEYEIINAYVEKSMRQREAEAYKKGYIAGGIDEITRTEKARQQVEKEIKGE